MENPFPRELRDLAHVTRWNIARLIKEQSVAEHCFFVAIYAYEIADIANEEMSVNVDKGKIVMKALLHDIEESYTSDIPGPAKRNIIDRNMFNDYISVQSDERFLGMSSYLIFKDYGENKSFNEYWVLKIANLLDETCLLASELQMGNKSVKAYFKMSRKRLDEAIHSSGWCNNTTLKLDTLCRNAVIYQENACSIPPSNDDDDLAS